MQHSKPQPICTNMHATRRNKARCNRQKQQQQQKQTTTKTCRQQRKRNQPTGRRSNDIDRQSTIKQQQKQPDGQKTDRIKINFPAPLVPPTPCGTLHVCTPRNAWDVCRGLMGWQGAGVALAPGWVNTIGMITHHPAGNHCSGERRPLNCTCNA